MPAPNTITVPQLLRLIGTPDAPRIVDVCIDADFQLDPVLIPGAIRQPFGKITDLVPELTNTRVVIICQKGKKLSQGAAALLRTHGIAAEVLEGGMVAWRDANAPAIPADAYPGPLWVTRHRPKIDRIACPWLIRRFIDPNARFLFVPPQDVADVADRYRATPFDTEDSDWSHQGAQCTFQVMYTRFGLTLPALEHMGQIIAAADTDQLDQAPQAAGLLALSLGLSRMYRDDLAQMEAGFTLYDALYRWARDATEESHDWPH